MKYKNFNLFVLSTLLAVLLSACASQQTGPAKAELSVDMGYAEGAEIYFTHTEVSDAKLAEKNGCRDEFPCFLRSHPRRGNRRCSGECLRIHEWRQGS